MKRKEVTIVEIGSDKGNASKGFMEALTLHLNEGWELVAYHTGVQNDDWNWYSALLVREVETSKLREETGAQ